MSVAADLRFAALYPHQRERVNTMLEEVFEHHEGLESMTAKRGGPVTPVRQSSSDIVLLFTFEELRWRSSFSHGDLVELSLISSCCERDGNQAQFAATRCVRCEQFFQGWSSENYWAWYENAFWCKKWDKLAPHITQWLEYKSPNTLLESALQAEVLISILAEFHRVFAPLTSPGEGHPSSSFPAVETPNPDGTIQ